MDFGELIRSAATALRSNLMRTFLTMLGIIIGIASVILIYAIGQGAVAFVSNELSFFGTNIFQVNPGNNMMATFTGSVATITLKDVEALQKDTALTNVESVAAFTTSSLPVAANDVNRTMMIYGMTPDISVILKPIMDHGDFINDAHNLGMDKVAVIGRKAATTFFGSDTDPVGETMKIDEKTFRVIGVVHAGSALFGSFFDNAIFVPLQTAVYGLSGSPRIQEVDISVKDTDLMNDTINQVTTILRDRHNLKEGDENDFIVASTADSLTIVQTITSVLTLIIVAISAISLIVGGVGVMNIMLVAVTERTREIGLLKAIGAQEKDILWQFIIEAVVMTGAGGVIGIMIGIGGAAAVAMVVHIPLVISPLAVIIALVTAMAVGIIFGLYPARHAARLSPIDALRYE